MMDGVAIHPTTFIPSTVSKEKINILHQHCEGSSPEMESIFTPEQIDLMDHVVFISHWQYEDFMCHFPWLDSSKCSIIKNATREFPKASKPKSDKLKLIYTSTPWRGLEYIPEIWEKLNRDDVELDVYSSLEIYGSSFVEHVHDQVGYKYERLFEKLDAIKGINYKGYVSNDEIRQACLDAHIYVYPCVYLEASCLSLMEALAAGCACVTTNLGALPETGSEFAYFVLNDTDMETLTDNYTKVLNRVIDNYWTPAVQEKLPKQQQFYLDHYNMETRAAEWKSLLTELKTLKQSGKRVTAF